MNILIYELTHYEIANVLLQIYKGNDITLVTTEELIPFIVIENGAHVILINKLNVFSTIGILQLNISLDQLIIGSIGYNYLLHYLLFKKLKSKKRLLFIHDINNFFKIPIKAKFKTRINFIGKKAFEKDTNWDYNLLYENLNLALKIYSKKKIILNIPGGLFSDNLYKLASWDDEQINIVIPGSVSSRRRDYEFVYRLITRLIDINEKRFKFILLGENQLDASQSNKFKLLSETNGIIQLFDKNVDAFTFQKVCESAHLFLFPTIQIFQSNNGVDEIYGETKASGNIGDAIHYGKPFLYPNNLNVPNELKSGAIYYDSTSDLLLKITRLNESIYNSLSRAARENASKFSVKNMQEYLKKRNYL